jgi:CBS domain-containing protein
MLRCVLPSLRHTKLLSAHFSSPSIRPPNINQKLVAQILAEVTPRKFTIVQSSTLIEAIDHFVTQQLASLLAVSDEGEVSGVLTARDVLKILHKHKYAEAFEIKVEEVMTPKEKMIFCTSEDTVSRVLELMYQVKIRNIPVIDDGEVSGIITLKDLADSAFDIMDIGGRTGLYSS